MTSRLGVYWSVEHRRPSDYDYFKALQPSVFKIMDAGTPDYQFAKDALPGALVIARDWALSEQHSDMLANPVGTGARHAREWNDHQARLGFDRANTLILGINEPTIWEPGVPEALRLYTISLCLEAKKYGLRVGAMQLGVGWPNNNGPDTPPDWSPFHGVEQAIIDNGGALICHEYWADQGPSELWGWWGGRALKCPWQVPIIIGECGIEMMVKYGDKGHHGWNGVVPAERYAAELAEYTSRMSADPRFVGCCVFASDFQAHDWYTFDIEPAYQAILATPIPDAKPPIGAVPTGAKTAYVAAPSGANLRKAPRVDGDLILSIPYGEQILVYPDDTGTNWRLVEYQGNSGYMASSLFTFAPPMTAPGPTGDNWSRAWPIVLDIEGGLSTDPNDRGNYRPDGTFVGTNFGISANAHPDVDIVNLTKEAALEIYKHDYWDASGANNLEWPLSLAVFDLAVNGGVGRAKQALAEAGPNFDRYNAWRLKWYTRLDQFDLYGPAWIRRVARIMEAA